jgi:hypothetical protein
MKAPLRNTETNRLQTRPEAFLEADALNAHLETLVATSVN